MAQEASMADDTLLGTIVEKSKALRQRARDIDDKLKQKQEAIKDVSIQMEVLRNKEARLVKESDDLREEKQAVQREIDKWTCGLDLASREARKIQPEVAVEPSSHMMDATDALITDLIAKQEPTDCTELPSAGTSSIKTHPPARAENAPSSSRATNIASLPSITETSGGSIPIPTSSFSGAVPAAAQSDFFAPDEKPLRSEFDDAMPGIYGEPTPIPAMPTPRKKPAAAKQKATRTTGSKNGKIAQQVPRKRRLQAIDLSTLTRHCNDIVHSCWEGLYHCKLCNAGVPVKTPKDAFLHLVRHYCMPGMAVQREYCRHKCLLCDFFAMDAGDIRDHMQKKHKKNPPNLETASLREGIDGKLDSHFRYLVARDEE